MDCICECEISGQVSLSPNAKHIAVPGFINSIFTLFEPAGAKMTLTWHHYLAASAKEGNGSGKISHGY